MVETHVWNIQQFCRYPADAWTEDVGLNDWIVEPCHLKAEKAILYAAVERGAERFTQQRGQLLTQPDNCPW